MKLHELLAIETNLENQADKCRTELAATFDKKRHLFEEKTTVFFPLAENEQPVTELQSDLQSTVRKELDWIGAHLAKSIDASYQVAEANTAARADVVLEDDAGTVILTGVPATALLELEKTIAKITSLITAIPTLDPAKGFTPDSQRGTGVFKAREVNKNRTRKQAKVLIKYEATKEHPAQTEVVTEDVAVGRIQEQEWSGLITPAEKAELINRAEILARAIRRARSRANEASVDAQKKIGSKLLKYLFD
jgi:hypothetical protein